MNQMNQPTPLAQPSMPEVGGANGAPGGAPMNGGGASGGAGMNSDGAPNGGAINDGVVSNSNTTIMNPNEGKVASILKTISVVVLSLTTLTFLGLFIWMTIQYNEASTLSQSQIDDAVAAAVMQQALDDEAEFAEREKEPYRDFAGPADYGQLSFEYPKTWSVYIASDASKGGDYEAYLNPIEVNPISSSTINALRVKIRDKDFESVAQEYQKYLTQKDAQLSVASVTVGGTSANRYTGTIPGTELSGVIVIFKIRDKTAILQTDSMLFLDDFNKLLDTVQFNA